MWTACRKTIALLAAAAMLSEASPRPNPSSSRTMTYWASASDPIVHGRPSCYPQPCPNWTAGSRDWEARFALLEKHRANFTGLIPTMHAITNGGKLGLNGDGEHKL